MGMRQRLGVAACLLGDPQLLILDEPMNGLDPAGMLEMRDMILSLVAEGRTVVLSSHLLDEVERTCDAVAIVDRGKVIRQGPIAELLAGSSFEVQVECSDPDRAAALLEGDGVRRPRRSAGPDGTRDLAAGGHGTRRHRRDQPPAGRGRDLGLPAPAHPGLARAVVPLGDQPTGSPRNDDHHRHRSRSPLRFRRTRRGDHRGSWIPTWGMITTRFMELRRRRGLMIALVAVNIGIPVVFLVVRLISHAVDPKSYGPAGGYDIFNTLVPASCTSSGSSWRPSSAARPGRSTSPRGCSATWSITGRSRLALYFARIPAGLAIVIAMVAVGYTIVCAVCVFAAPTQLNYDGVNVPAGLSQPALDSWAAGHADEVICNFNYNGSDRRRRTSRAAVRPSVPRPAPSSRRRRARSPCPRTRRHRSGPSPSRVANQDYAGLQRHLPVPSDLADGRRRPVDRTRGDHRVHRRPGAVLADGTADGPGDPPRRAGADPDADLQPPRHRLHAQRPAGHRRRGHGRTSSPATCRRRSVAAAPAAAVAAAWAGSCSARSPPWWPHW